MDRFGVVVTTLLLVASVQTDGEYTDWEEWGECTASCGQGTQQRVRDCESGSCTDPLHENRDCQGMDCGEWEWEEWGECTASCGGGEQKRDSVCSEESCEGQAEAQETRECNTEQCEWEEWSEWSDCVCGAGGTRKTRRERSCSGGDCGQGDTYQEKTCIISEITFLGNATSTSTGDEDTEKDNVIDNDKKTCWESVTQPKDEHVYRTFTVDLGATRRILGVKVTLARIITKVTLATKEAEVWVGDNLCGKIEDGESNGRTVTVQCNEGCGYEGSEVMIKIDSAVNGRMKFCKIKILGEAESEPEL